MDKRESGTSDKGPSYRRDSIPYVESRCGCPKREEEKYRKYRRDLQKGLDKAYPEVSGMVTESLKESIERIISRKVGTQYLDKGNRHETIAPALLPATQLRDGSIGLLHENFMITLSMLGKPLVPYAPAIEIFFNAALSDDILHDITRAILQRHGPQISGLAVVIHMPGRRRHFEPPTSVFFPRGNGELVFREHANEGAWSDWMQKVHDLEKSAQTIIRTAEEDYEKHAGGGSGGVR